MTVISFHKPAARTLPDSNVREVSNLNQVNDIYDGWFKANPEIKLQAILVLPAQGECNFIHAKDKRGREYLCALPLSAAALHSGIKTWLELRTLRSLRVMGGGFLRVDGTNIDVFGSSRNYGSANHSRAAQIIRACFPQTSVTVLGDSSQGESLFPHQEYCLPLMQKRAFDGKDNMRRLPAINNNWLARAILRLEQVIHPSVNSIGVSDLTERKELERIARMKFLYVLKGDDLFEILDRQSLLVDRKLQKRKDLEYSLCDPEHQESRHSHINYFRAQVKRLLSRSSERLEARVQAWSELKYMAEKMPDSNFKQIITSCLARCDAEIRESANVARETFWDYWRYF